MKKNVLYLGFILSAIFSSCHDDIIPLQENCNNINSLNKELICYPKIKSALYSRGTSFENDWEKWEKVTLPSGDSVYTPWNPSMSGTDIPIEIRQDIKKVNGWKLIAHTMKGYGEKGMNYLLFYNRYTGILKVFYYLEHGLGQLQNTGIWKLHFESQQSLLNFTTEYAKPASEKDINDFYIGNITNNDAKGFSIGWNCFQVELAYDPDLTSAPLQIIPYNISVTNIEFEGELVTTTTGTIIHAQSENVFNNQIKAVASFAGNSAEEWVSKAVKDKAFKKITDLIVSGAGSIVESGVGFLLRSFLGGFKKDKSTTQSVQLRTDGHFTMTGQLSTVESGIIMPLSLNLSKENVGSLGVWCLAEEPIIRFNPIAYSFGDTEKEIIKTYYLPYNSLLYKPILNPEIAELIEKPDFQYKLYECIKCDHGYAFDYDHGPVTYLKKNWNEKNKLYDYLYDIENIPVDIYLGSENPPQVAYILDAPDGSKGAVGNINFEKYNIASFYLYFYININGEDTKIVSSHQFDINKYEWEPWCNEYKNIWPFNKNS